MVRPMLRHKRLDKIITSNNIHDGYLNRELAIARAQTASDDLNPTSAGAIRGMWAEKLHRSVDGIGLKEACRVKSSNAFVEDGSRLLSGRDYVHIAQTRIKAIYSRSRTTRGRHGLRRKCRAGFGKIETANHISQTCPSTKEHRIRRHNTIASYIARGLAGRGFGVSEEPIVRLADGRTLKPGIIARLANRVIVIDVQVVGDQTDLDYAHLVKVDKYSEPALLAAIGGEGIEVDITSCTLNWRRVWSGASYLELSQLGIVSNFNSKLFSIKAALGTYIGNRLFNGQLLDQVKDDTSLIDNSIT